MEMVPYINSSRRRALQFSKHLFWQGSLSAMSCHATFRSFDQCKVAMLVNSVLLSPLASFTSADDRPGGRGAILSSSAACAQARAVCPIARDHPDCGRLDVARFPKHQPIAALDYSAFIEKPAIDPRDQRDRYTDEDSRQLFSLPPWTGFKSCSG